MDICNIYKTRFLFPAEKTKLKLFGKSFFTVSIISGIIKQKIKLMPSSAMAARLTLDQLIGVRIPGGQPIPAVDTFSE
jgi:hypothetical protein